jgi:putative tryptophan/tyrosine transport system substrate-binding protein
MRRRDFLAGGLAAAAGAGSTRAQQKPKHIGLFHVGLDHVPPSVSALRRALVELGYQDGTGLRYDWRNQASEETARTAAASFVRERVDIIVPVENQALRAAVAATKEIPIFFMQVVDPIGEGVVQSFARPGGNVTGLVAPDLTAKRMEIYAELDGLPRRVLGLMTPTDFRNPEHVAMRRVAASRDIDLIERKVATLRDIESAFGEFSAGELGGVILMTVGLGTNFRADLLALATRRNVPFIAHRREWVEEGAVLSYGVDFAEMGRVAALYVDKILKGTWPAELPVDEAAGIRLAVNLRSAKALGIAIPPSLVLRADEVIE